MSEPSRGTDEIHKARQCPCVSPRPACGLRSVCSRFARLWVLGVSGVAVRLGLAVHPISYIHAVIYAGMISSASV